MTSTLTSNLVKMDDLYFIPLFPVLSVIYFSGLGIKNVVIKYEHWSGTSGREQLVNRRNIWSMYTLMVAIALPNLFYLICTMYMMISIMPVRIPVSTLEEPMMLSLDSYSTYLEVAKSWDQLQVGNKCCGVHNYTDWFGLSSHECDSFKPLSPKGVPDSCCNPLTVGCGRNVTNLENIYPTGCLKSLADHIEKKIDKSAVDWLLGVQVVLCIVAVWCIVNLDKMMFVKINDRNNDIENTPLIEESVSDDHEIDIEDEGVNTDGLINIRDDEENEYNGNEGGSVGTTVIHTADVHRDVCTYSDDHT